VRRAISAEYDAVHERVIVRAGGLWIVSDWLRAVDEHDYTLRFQLGAPAQGRCSLVDDGQVRIDSPGLLLLQPARPGVRTGLFAGWVSPQYGHKDPAPAVVSSARGADVNFDTVLRPGHEADPRARIVDMPVPGGPPDPLLRIEHTCHGRQLVDTWLHARGQGESIWHFDDLVFSGLWLLLRRDDQGRLLQAVAAAGAELRQAGRPVNLSTAREARR